jgi:hypothetical protein
VWLKLKLLKTLRWYFQVYGLVSIFGCLHKSTRLCHGRRKSFKALKICSFLLDFYFVIVEVSSCISTMYNLLL